MKITKLKKFKNKDLVVFDVDGTLAPTKSPMEADMSELLRRLLKLKKVAIISGAKYEIFKMQLLNELKISKKLLENLFLFPTTATTFFRYDNGWKKVYSLTLSMAEAKKIKKTFEKV